MRVIVICGREILSRDGGIRSSSHPTVLRRYPDCTHTHEDQCAIKDAVADGRLDERRYESYCHLREGDFE
jgi:hypothetical protein